MEFAGKSVFVYILIFSLILENLSTPGDSGVGTPVRTYSHEFLLFLREHLHFSGRPTVADEYSPSILQ